MMALTLWGCVAGSKKKKPCSFYLKKKKKTPKQPKGFLLACEINHQAMFYMLYSPSTASTHSN